MSLAMENPPGKKPANATIQLDRADLNEILLLDNPDGGEAPPAASVPPPLPPEELARAASLAPIGSIPPANAAPPGKGIWIAIGFVAVLAIAIGAGVLVGNAVRTSPQPVAAASQASPPSTPNAQPSEPATQTITIHTMELGGKETRDQ